MTKCQIFIYKSKMLYGSVLYLAVSTLQSHFFDCTILWWCSKFPLFRNGCSLCLQSFFEGIVWVLILKTLSPSAMSALPLFHFHFWNSPADVEHWCWIWTCWVLVFFLFSFTYSQSMIRALVGMWRLTTRVRVTLFHLREFIYLCI